MATQLVTLKVARRSATNRYKVPQRQWRKWDESERFRFNEVYSTMVSNQPMFLHPETRQVKRAEWKTVAWNAAWTAASA